MDTATVTVQTLAKEAVQWFETARRETGTTSPDGRDDTTEGYVRLTEGQGQYMEASEVYGLVLHALEDRLEEVTA